MKMREFIKENRAEIDRLIGAGKVIYCEPMNDEERELQILDDERLRLWAESAGVKI